MMMIIHDLYNFDILMAFAWLNAIATDGATVLNAFFNIQLSNDKQFSNVNHKNHLLKQSAIRLPSISYLPVLCHFQGVDLPCQMSTGH